MKRLLALFLAAFSLLLLAADYELILLGDLHYDGARYRSGATDIKASRQQEFARNAKIWKKNIPAELKAAGSLVSPRTRYVIQLGDIVQGDAASEALQLDMLRDALAAVSTHFGKTPLLLVKGNHDIRSLGPEGYDAAYKSLVLPILAEKIKPAEAPQDMNYAVRVGGDLLLFIDSVNPELERIQAEIDRNPGFKRLLVFTHIPILPCPGANVCYNYTPGSAGLAPKANIQPENRRKLLDMLATYNAYIFSAHTHTPAIVEWKSAKGRLIQLTSSGMAKEAGSPAFILRAAGAAAIGKGLLPKDLPAFREEYKPVRFLEAWSGWGCVVLKLTDDAVIADLYSGDGKSPVETVVLSRPMPEKLLKMEPVPAESP